MNYLEITDEDELQTLSAVFGTAPFIPEQDDNVTEIISTTYVRAALTFFSAPVRQPSLWEVSA